MKFSSERGTDPYNYLYETNTPIRISSDLGRNHLIGWKIHRVLNTYIQKFLHMEPWDTSQQALEIDRKNCLRIGKAMITHQVDMNDKVEEIAKNLEIPANTMWFRIWALKDIFLYGDGLRMHEIPHVDFVDPDCWDPLTDDQAKTLHEYEEMTQNTKEEAE